MDFAKEMRAGRARLREGQWSSAYACFQRAHDLGHGVRAEHLAAHRAALHTSWRARRPDRLLYQAVFLAFASLTSYGRPADALLAAPAVRGGSR
ncbi:DUF3703 domain-containing protein [Streptomyces sp. OE57]|uniref:DUF3703 domain-containing protein n=1 Tax=Streptomyces lacaronensis TaxID=3379885 RepID=UPI0039B760BF